MAVGFEFQGRCFASAAEAADAFYTSFNPQVVSGSTSYVTLFSKEGGLWKSKGYSINSSGAWTLRFTTNATVPTFPQCDTAESFNDGLVIGWGIVAAMVAAWAISHMRKGLFR